MSILFLSDFHLGSPLFSSTDKIITLLSKDYELVVLIGDIFDVWEDDINSIIKNHKVLLDRINSLDNLVVIKGNHDPNMDVLRSIFAGKMVVENYELDIEGKKCLIVHGDECDDLIRKHIWLAKLVFPIQWLFERLLKINLKGWLRELVHSISAKIQHKNYNALVMDVEKDLVNKYSGEYDCIIVGHTHLPKLVKNNGFSYVNCGDWIHNKTYVICTGGTLKLVGYINA